MADPADVAQDLATATQPTMPDPDPDPGAPARTGAPAEGGPPDRGTLSPVTGEKILPTEPVVAGVLSQGGGSSHGYSPFHGSAYYPTPDAPPLRATPNAGAELDAAPPPYFSCVSPQPQPQPQDVALPSDPTTPFAAPAPRAHAPSSMGGGSLARVPACPPFGRLGGAGVDSSVHQFTRTYVTATTPSLGAAATTTVLSGSKTQAGPEGGKPAARPPPGLPSAGRAFVSNPSFPPSSWAVPTSTFAALPGGGEDRTDDVEDEYGYDLFDDEEEPDEDRRLRLLREATRRLAGAGGTPRSLRPAEASAGANKASDAERSRPPAAKSTPSHTAAFGAGRQDRQPVTFSSPPPPYCGATGWGSRPQVGVASACCSPSAPSQFEIIKAIPDRAGMVGDFLVSGYVVGGEGVPGDETRFFEDLPLTPGALPDTPEGDEWAAAWDRHTAQKRISLIVAPSRVSGGYSRPEDPRSAQPFRPSAPPRPTPGPVCGDGWALERRAGAGSASASSRCCNHGDGAQGYYLDEASMCGETPLPPGTYKLRHEGGFVSYVHSQLSFFSEEVGGSGRAPPGGCLQGSSREVFSLFGVKSGQEVKALFKIIQAHDLWVPLRDQLKRASDADQYAWVRQGLCERLVQITSARSDPSAAWTEILSNLRGFLAQQTKPGEEYGFLATFLRNEEHRRGVDGCPFARLLRELDRYFGHASQQEQRQLFLEQAKSSSLSRTKLISEVAREKSCNLERAGGYTPEGLFYEIRSACSEIVRSLPLGELRQCLLNLDSRLDSSGGVARGLDPIIEAFDEFERSTWGRRLWSEHWDRVAPPAGARQGGGRPEGTGRGVFPAGNGNTPLLGYSPGSDSSFDAPPGAQWLGLAGSVGGGGGSNKRVTAIDRPGAFDEDFVQREGVPGQPAPNTVSRRGQGQPPRKFLNNLQAVAEAIAPHLAGLMPPLGQDVIAGYACPGCGDTRPGTVFSVSKDYYEHEELRKHHAELIKPYGPGVRFYHSIASCPHLWKRLHIYVRAHPDRVDLFDHAVGPAPPTRTLFTPHPIEPTAAQ